MFKPPAARALASLLLVPLVGACTPPPSDSGVRPREQAAETAKPEEVCAHVRGVADKDTDDAAILDQVERECVETLTAMQTRYETFTTCVNLAGDQAAILECEKQLGKPRSLVAASGPMATVEALCNHVLQLLGAELGKAGSDIGPAELEQLRSQCIADAGAQLEVKGPEAFNQEAECIMKAQTLDQLQACGL